MGQQDFKRWELTDTSTVAPLFEADQRRGIYVLEFDNRERYVGQTENVVSRYATHRHGSRHHAPWDDIAAIEFLRVSEGSMDALEQQTIKGQRKRTRLRNRTFNFGHWEPSAIDEVVAPEVQRHWATGQPEYSLDTFANAPKPTTTDIPKLISRRRGLEALPDGKMVWEAVVDELAQVVALVIPNATETEGLFWSISDYPETAGGRFATLNVGSLELVYFPRLRFKPEIGPLQASSGLVSVLNASMEAFIDYKELADRFSPDESVASYEELDGHAVEFWRSPTSYSVPTDSVQMPLGVFGASALDDDGLAGVRSLAIHAMRRGSARINARSRSETLTRLVYQRITTPDFQTKIEQRLGG